MARANICDDVRVQDADSVRPQWRPKHNAGYKKGRMSKVRINDLARELEVKSKAILDALPLVGVTEKKTHSSSLEEHEAEKVRVHLRGSSEAQAPSARSARPLRGEEEIKTKIDLSHISRPGDVLKAITQQKEAVAPARPAAPPL